MNPDLPLEWYLNLLSGIKAKFPGIHVHAFSPPEFIEFVHFFNPPGTTLEDKIRWVMVRLREAGLDSLPGGGGEIFAPAVRRKIGLGKCDAEAWLTVMYVAHSLGMFTSATMMFGHIEGHADRVHHMMMVREWQDRALREGGSDEGAKAGRDEGRAKARDRRKARSERSVTPGFGHYKAFISWPFQRENTPLGRVKDWGVEGSWSGSFRGMEWPGRLIWEGGHLWTAIGGVTATQRGWYDLTQWTRGTRGGGVRETGADVGGQRLSAHASVLASLPGQHLLDRRIVGDDGAAHRAGGACATGPATWAA